MPARLIAPLLGRSCAPRQTRRCSVFKSRPMVSFGAPGVPGKDLTGQRCGHNSRLGRKWPGGSPAKKKQRSYRRSASPAGPDRLRDRRQARRVSRIGEEARVGVRIRAVNGPPQRRLAAHVIFVQRHFRRSFALGQREGDGQRVVIESDWERAAGRRSSPGLPSCGQFPEATIRRIARRRPTAAP